MAPFAGSIAKKRKCHVKVFYLFEYEKKEEEKQPNTTPVAEHKSHTNKYRDTNARVRMIYKIFIIIIRYQANMSQVTLPWIF